MTSLSELGLTELPEVLGEERSLVTDGWWLDGTQVDAVVVAVAPAGAGEKGVEPRPGTADAAARYGIDLVDLAARRKLTGRAGETTVLDLPRPLPGRAFGWEALPTRLVLLGVGDAGSGAMRKVGSALCRATAGLGTVVTSVAGTTVDDAGRTALLEGFWLTAYRGPRIAQSPPAGDPPARRLVLLGHRGPPEQLDAARVAATATVRARFLAATPSNVKNPQWFAEQARELAAGVPGVRVEVHDEAWLRRTGLGALLAVGSGSATPPRLVTATYSPRRATGRIVALVGKGITFDTGGISIKPRESMVGMKSDMAGAGAVLATVLAAAELGLPHRLVGVLPLAENAVGASSYRPGDIVRAYDGTSIEVSNTDAEGRMVLADAMSWVRDTAQPDVLVDVATLTGAATLGLGRSHAALYASQDSLARALLAAGEESGERAWRMPLVESYRASLDSDVADIAHQSRDPHVHGGSITAALFLQHFAGDIPWAHLDIAGAGRATKARDEVPEGPTGYGPRLLLRWLQSLS